MPPRGQPARRKPFIAHPRTTLALKTPGAKRRVEADALGSEELGPLLPRYILNHKQLYPTGNRRK
jgi:hypothetical protein